MHVYLIENVPKNYRVLVSCLVSYSPNYVLTAGLAYLAQDWRRLLHWAALMNLPAMLTLWWVCRDLGLKY